MGMYFNNIDKPGEIGDDDPGGVACQYINCGDLNFLDYEDFKEFNKDYIVLKDGVSVNYGNCGSPSEQILRLRPENLDPLGTSQYTPKCPICHSPNIHKIKLGTKVSRAAIFGIFALPKAGKEWHCDNCGSEF